ncbi:unnamed protein product [Parnassius apollo]|uniref:(apollo) hypothetical protein n=1 Tax=Parnassius apollo TaxID=110799 RepID=A0A8S3W689_PARAO|nr:unnamed protein product [Parnassius apollo]
MRTGFFVCFAVFSSVVASTTKNKRGLFQEPLCKENEEFKVCETCYRSCDNPKPSCSDQCEKGCFCKEGFMRNREERCVTMKECPSGNGTEARNISCGLHKAFRDCGGCEKTCSDPDLSCAVPCRMGCFCEEGYVKHPNGNCVKIEECPEEVTQVGVLEESVEQCGSEEEFVWCGWCEPSCRQPAPRCPLVCTRGCQCRPPLLRDRNGRCVRHTDCIAREQSQFLT